MEPALDCVAALWSPSTGIIDSHGYMTALLGDAERAGAMLALLTPLLEARRDGDAWQVATGGAEALELEARAGSSMPPGCMPSRSRSACDGFPQAAVPPLHLAKGHYFSLRGRSPFTRLIYPTPIDGGLGVHLTLDLAGQARFGPDVEWLADADPDTIDYTVDPSRAPAFAADIRRYWPGLRRRRAAAGLHGRAAEALGHRHRRRRLPHRRAGRARLSGRRAAVRDRVAGADVVAGDRRGSPTPRRRRQLSDARQPRARTPPSSNSAMPALTCAFGARRRRRGFGLRCQERPWQVERRPPGPSRPAAARASWRHARRPAWGHRRVRRRRSRVSRSRSNRVAWSARPGRPERRSLRSVDRRRRGMRISAAQWRERAGVGICRKGTIDAGTMPGSARSAHDLEQAVEAAVVDRDHAPLRAPSAWRGRRPRARPRAIIGRSLAPSPTAIACAGAMPSAAQVSSSIALLLGAVADVAPGLVDHAAGERAVRRSRARCCA